MYIQGNTPKFRLGEAVGEGMKVEPGTCLCEMLDITGNLQKANAAPLPSDHIDKGHKE